MIRKEARFVEPGDAFVVGRGRGKPFQQVNEKLGLRRVQEADLLVDLGMLRTVRLSIEWHGLTRVSRQDQRFGRQREELV